MSAQNFPLLNFLVWLHRFVKVTRGGQVQPWVVHNLQTVRDECNSIFRPDFLGVALELILIVHSVFNYKPYLKTPMKLLYCLNGSVCGWGMLSSGPPVPNLLLCGLQLREDTHNHSIARVNCVPIRFSLFVSLL